MKYCAKSLIWIGLVTLLKCQVANAAVHNISQGQLPICNNWNNSWSISGSTYTCSASVSFVAGDEYVSNSPITLRADAGITLSGNKVGSVSSPIALQTTYGTLNATVGSSVVYGNLTAGSGSLILAGVSLIGNVQTGGTVTIDNSTLSGTVNGSGQGTIRNSSVSGTVAFNNGLTGVNAVFSSTLTSTNGSVNLSGGSVAGLVNVACCKVTVSQGAVISNGILAGNNGIDIRNSTVSGDLKAGNNPIVMVNVNMTSGTISPGNNSLTITGGAVTADVTNAHRVFISDNAVVTGDVLARYEVSVSDSKVVGDIATVVGHDGLHHVYLTNSEVYGNVTVRDDWGTINGDASSRIYGDCTYSEVVPISLCEAGGGPDPIDPLECNISLDVGPMIAGKPHSATVVFSEPDLESEGSSCERPSKLKILFDYLEPEEHKKELISINSFSVAEGGLIELDVEGGDEPVTLDINYKEVGRLSLAVLGSGNKIMASSSFVSRPYGFCIEPVSVSPCVSDKDYPLLCTVEGKPIRAGEVFDLSVRAVAWEGDVSEHTAQELCGSSVVENYRQGDSEDEESVTIGPKVQGLPSEAGDGVLLLGDGELGSKYAHLLGEKTIIGRAVSEVGVFRIQLTPPDYLGVKMDGTGDGIEAISAISSSDPIGRFAPAYLNLTHTIKLSPGCGGFTYQNQSMSFLPSSRLEITGHNHHGGVTNNYDWNGDEGSDGLWGFPDIELGENTEDFKQRFFSYTNDSRLDATHPLPDNLAQECTNTEGDMELQRLKACQPSRLQGNSTITLLPDDLPWDGKRAFELGGEVQYLRNQQPDLSDLPFLAALRLFIGKDNLKDKDDTFYSQDQGKTGTDYISPEISGSEIRLGRLNVGNAHGSELQDLDVPWVIESWQAPGVFLPELQDSCSAPIWGQAQASEQTEELVGKQLHISGGQIGHQGDLTIEKPEASGTARIGFPYVPEWLEYDWRGEGPEASRGLATFGIYKGPQPLIFRREVYR